MWHRIGPLTIATLFILVRVRAGAQNLIPNGDFEHSYYSGYQYDAGLPGPGAYVIGTDPSLYHPGVSSFGDHTTGTGKMLIADGSTTAGTPVWQTTVSVSPGKDYQFTAWCASWGPPGSSVPSAARFQLFVNGVKVGGEFQAPAQVAQWASFQRTWNSGTDQQAILSLVDVNTDYDYNDFALDDLTFVADGNNLLATGSSFDDDFTSDYTLSDSVFPEGTYVIGHNPHDHHSGGASFTDHTSGAGNMLIANGSTNAGATVWRQTVSIPPNSSYTFSAWTASWGTFGGTPDPSPSTLRIFVNDVQIGSDFTVTAQNGAWTQMVALFSTGSESSVTIRIVDVNTEPVGNDFVLDDISLIRYNSADFSGDGVSDILLNNQTDGRIAVLAMNKTAIKGSSSLSKSLPAGWRIVGSGDFNGDLHNEIVVQNTVTRAVSILFVNGTQIVSSVPVNPTLPANWVVAAVADIDGDHKPDLIVQNTATQQIAVLLMDGTTIRQSKSFSKSLAPGWSIVGAGDFDGDGQTDLVVQNASTRQISILTLSGTTITGSFALNPTLPANWSVGGVGDYDGDGKPDLVVQNSVTRQISVLTIANGKITGSIPVTPTAPVGWKLVGPK